MEKSSTDLASYSAQLSGCAIRARVAFALALAEFARTKIDADEEVVGKIRAALDLAWLWE